MMQHTVPDDWILATGETHTVKEFAQIAFNYAGLDWEKFVKTNKKYLRPNEVEHLLGDSSKARKNLKWKPKVSFTDLVKLMVDYDINEAKKEYTLLRENLVVPTWEYPLEPK